MKRQKNRHCKVRTWFGSKRDKIVPVVFVISALAGIVLVLISQIRVVAESGALPELLDVMFNVFTIVFSLMFSATFLISYRDVSDRNHRREMYRLLHFRQIIMFAMLVSMAVSYLAIKHGKCDTLNLSLSIGIFAITTIGCIYVLIRICKSQEEIGRSDHPEDAKTDE